jgi:NADH-quinone oxidoreductase subunit L
MTAFYMFRLYYMTFHGAFRGTEEQAHHLHESPKAMTVPLMVLAVGSAFAGFLGMPVVLGQWIGMPNLFEHFLEPALANAHHAYEQVFTHVLHETQTELLLMAASIGVAIAGFFLARFLYKSRPELSERMAQTFAPIHRLLTNKYYVDEIYGALFVRGAALGGGRTLHAVDRMAIDGGDGEVKAGGGVNGLAWLTRDVVAVFSNAWDRYVVDMLVNAVAVVLDNLSYLFRAAQNGLVQQYALAMLIGLFLLFASGRWVLGLY